jgi:hypothetical protein
MCSLLRGPVGEGGDEVSVARFVADQRTLHRVPHTVSCLVLGLSPSWFYNWVRLGQVVARGGGRRPQLRRLLVRATAPGALAGRRRVALTAVLLDRTFTDAGHPASIPLGVAAGNAQR